MKNDTLERTIKKAVLKEAQRYTAPDMMGRQIRKRIDEQERKEVTMKKFGIKKIAAAAAVAVMLTGTVCIAGGMASSVYSRQSVTPDYVSYESLSLAEKKAGVVTNAPESFSNGFGFMGIHMVDNVEQNDKKNTVDQYQSVSIKYVKDGQRLIFSVSPRISTQDIDESYYTNIFESDGMTYYYKEIRNKFVPDGYVPTAEEEELMEMGLLNIGVGTETIEESTARSIGWEQNGMSHELYDPQSALTADELLSMAKEVAE